MCTATAALSPPPFQSRLYHRDVYKRQAFAAACAVFGNPTRLLAKKPVEGEAGFTVSGLTEDALAEKLRALEARGVRVLNRIRISDY